MLLILIFLGVESHAGLIPANKTESRINKTAFTPTETEKMDAWNGIDKLKHYSVSLILTTSVYYYMKKPLDLSNKSSIVVSVPFTFTVGLGKEFIDRGKEGNHFSFKDLVVDIMGIASGWVIVNNLR